MSIKLYGHPLSQMAYKVRLALSLLKVAYQPITVDLLKGEQRSDWFLKLNPRGKIPVYVEDDFTLWESNAIVLYLAERFAPNNLLPADLRTRALMHQWIQFEAAILSDVVGQARFQNRFAPPHLKNEQRLQDGQKQALANFAILDGHLSKNDFLAGEFSAADLAIYPHYAIAAEGEIDTSRYEGLKSWAKRVEELPGFIGIYDDKAN